MNKKFNFYGVAQDSGRLSLEITNAAKGVANAGRLDPMEAMRWHLQSNQNQARLASELYLAWQDNENGKELPGTRARRASSEYMSEFLNAMKAGIRPVDAIRQKTDKYGLLLDALTELGGDPVGSEGGFLTPEIFDGLVELQRSFVDLGALCTQAPVNSLRGWRAIEEATPAVPLEEITENAEMISEIESPTFAPVTFQLKDYGGFLKVVASLFEDTPVAIMTYLASWWSRKVALRNDVLVKALVDTLSPVTPGVSLVQSIKDALINTLDPEISAGAVVVVNPTGLAMLDSAVDGEGHQLMAVDWILAKHPVLTVSSTVWEDDDIGNTTPVFVGDLAQFATRFFAPYILVTDGGQGRESWRMRNIEVKGVYRVDIEVSDLAAGVLIAPSKGA
ncbi:MAG: phage major capsid protein [Chloroflexi bacterium]|nr:phage major capsid protein [Chloroflexota bacterium]